MSIGALRDSIPSRRASSAGMLRRPGLVFLLLVLAGFSAAGILRQEISVLEVSAPDAGHALWCARMKAGEEFVISYTHSVNKRPVYDTLRVESDHLVIVKSRFDAFGAGMPEGSTDEGRLAVLPDGWLEWVVNRPVPEIVVRVGRVAGHTLIVKGREIPLAQLAEPGSALLFRVRKISLFNAIRGGCTW
jgi:hypothetical protein